MRVAGRAARADGDGGQAHRDRNVRVGRGAVEIRFRAERARGFQGESDERLFGRSHAARSVADEFHFEFERRSARAPRRVLVLRRLACRASENGVESRKFFRRLRAQVNVHRSFARDDVDAAAAFDASDVEGRARTFRRGVRGQARDRATQCVHGVRHTEVAPRVPARAAAAHAVSARRERRVRDAL